MDASNTLYGQIFDMVAKASRFMRPYQGRVLSVDDLERRGRVQCAVDELGWFTQAEAPWCEPVYRGGHLCVPAVGDYVMIAFLAGSGARPIWDGLLGEVSGQQPAEYDGPKKRVLYSRDGRSVVHDEDDDTLTVDGFDTVKINGGSWVELNGDGERPVVYSDLKTALDNFKSSINSAISGAITGHTHAVTTAPGTTGPGAGAAPAVTVNIAASESQKVKIGG